MSGERIVLEVDSSEMVYDANGLSLGCWTGIKGFDDNSKAKIKAVLKLREAGFSAEEILEIKQCGLL